MPSKSPVAPNYTWDERTGRYRGPTGRFVTQSEIRAACQDTAKASGDNISRITGDLREGNISLAEWQTGMMREIKLLHTAQAAAARGGWAQMSQSDWGYVGSIIKQQYKYLEGFAIDIETGKQPLDGRLQVRASLYAKAGSGTFEDMRRRWQQNDNAMTEEHRVITAQESCPDCLEWSGRGWVPIGTLPRIGASVCRTNCKCYFSYRRKGPDGKYVTSQ